MAAETLGVSVDCRDELEIKKAYRKMALKYHPDKNVDLTPAMAKAKFQVRVSFSLTRAAARSGGVRARMPRSTCVGSVARLRGRAPPSPARAKDAALRACDPLTATPTAHSQDVADAFQRMSKECSGERSDEEEDGPSFSGFNRNDPNTRDMDVSELFAAFFGQMFGGGMPGGFQRGFQPRGGFRQPEEEEEEEEEEEDDGWSDDADSDNIYVFDPFEDEGEEEDGEGGDRFVFVAGVGLVEISPVGAPVKKKVTGEPKRDPMRAGGVAAAATKAAQAAAKRGVAPGRGAKSAPGGTGGATGGKKKKRK